MSEFYFDAQIERNRTLCLAPLTDRELATAEVSVEDAYGYYLYERIRRGNQEELEIIAHVPTDEAADRLRILLSMK